MVTSGWVPCAECGEKRAMSAEWLADIRTKVPHFPPFVPNVCVRCAMKDPARKAEMDAWTEAYKGRVVGGLRNALARPLDAIDRFVESLK